MGSDLARKFIWHWKVQGMCVVNIPLFEGYILSKKNTFY